MVQLIDINQLIPNFQDKVEENILASAIIEDPEEGFALIVFVETSDGFDWLAVQDLTKKGTKKKKLASVSELKH